jgi:2-dehydro-3-deoxy-D-gluconate 5-dehydrogenase
MAVDLPFSLEAFSLRGQTALVTGANDGIGRGIAEALAAAGADIVTAGRSPATATGEAVRAQGRRHLDVVANLDDVAGLPAVARSALGLSGHVDVLVNNAGTIRRSDAAVMSREDWDAVMTLNLDATFFLTQAVAGPMLERGRGKIINIASMLSFQGGIRVAAYTASKSAIAGITRGLANEWAGRGLNVNAIAPGYVATRNTQALREDENRSREILARIPQGRWATPKDLGGAAVFLASAASDYVNGAILPVDGGWLAR